MDTLYPVYKLAVNTIYKKRKFLSYGLKEYEENISKTSNKLMFLPWLHGERTPYWSSDLRGALIGIGIDTDKKSIDNAIIKGVGLTEVKLIEQVNENVEDSGMVVIAGGGVH